MGGIMATLGRTLGAGKAGETTSTTGNGGRIDLIVTDLVAAAREVLRKHDVTFPEYGAAMKFFAQTQQAKELNLLVDLFFNTTIVEIQNKKTSGSPNDLQGPYFREDVPVVTDGHIKTMEQFGGEPLVIRGKVTDVDGKPVPDATMYIWSSTPDGKYSGFHDDIPVEFYRGKLVTGSGGEFNVESTVPVPYQIPNKGPVGALLESMGKHSWRPAHVHFKVRSDKYQELTTQAYFEGEEWVGDDCADGMHTRDFVVPNVVDGGKRIMELNFTLDAKR